MSLLNEGLSACLPSILTQGEAKSEAASTQRIHNSQEGMASFEVYLPWFLRHLMFFLQGRKEILLSQQVIIGSK